MANDFFLDYTIGELSRLRIEAFTKLLKEILSPRNAQNKDMLISHIADTVPEIGDLIIREYLEYLIRKD